MNLPKGVHFMDLGLIEYQKCWDFQTKLFNESSSPKNIIIEKIQIKKKALKNI